MMTIIAPSLLACDFLNIEQELDSFKGINDLWLHLDIMDSHFVPNLTFGHPLVKLISKKTDIPLDAHFMVTNPKFYIETFKDFNLRNFTFHIEATSSEEELLDLIKMAKKLYPSVGISIKPNTPVSSLSEDILELIDLVLVMSVEPGFGGQSFIENTYEKVKQLTKLKTKFNFTIQIDGGVSNKNSQKLIQTGADNLVAGSYIFKANSQDYSQMIEGLRA